MKSNNKLLEKWATLPPKKQFKYASIAQLVLFLLLLVLPLIYTSSWTSDSNPIFGTTVNQGKTHSISLLTYWPLIIAWGFFFLVVGGFSLFSFSLLKNKKEIDLQPNWTLIVNLIPAVILVGVIAYTWTAGGSSFQQESGSLNVTGKGSSYYSSIWTYLLLIGFVITAFMIRSSTDILRQEAKAKVIAAAENGEVEEEIILKDQTKAKSKKKYKKDSFKI